MKNFSIQAKLDERGIDSTLMDDAVARVFMDGMGRVAQAARAEWMRLAKERLSTSRDIYVQGLQQADSFKVTGSTPQSTTYELQLVGRMANDFEFGKPSYDMKSVRPGWLGGSKARTAKDGHKYVVIPFRHSTSDTSRRFGYTGKAKAIASPDLKTQLKKAVKDHGLDRMVKTATGAVVPGPVSRVPKSAAVHPYLKGLTRVQQPTVTHGKGQSTLKTWRIMSEKSKPGSWIMPELKGVEILPSIEAFIDRQLDLVIDEILGR